MGGSGPSQDYRPEIDNGLQQANMPKSDLSRQLSALFGGMLAGQGNQNHNQVQTPGQTFQGNYGNSSGMQPGGILTSGEAGAPVFNPQNQTSGMSPQGPNYNQQASSWWQQDQGNQNQTQGNQPWWQPQNQNTQPGIDTANHNPVPGYDTNNNPFAALGNLNGQSQVNQVANSGMFDPRLTNQFSLNPQFNPQTGNTQGFTSGNLQGVNTSLDLSQAQRLGSNLNNPQLQFQDFGSGINQALGNFNPHQANLNNVNTNVNAGNPLPTDANSQYSQAVQQILGQKQNQDVADLRARFGASGGSSRGTPAQYAEAQLRAQQAPQIAAALGQIRQQESGIDLANRQLGVQAQTASGQLGLDSRSQDLNNYQNTQGNILQSLGLGVQNANNMGNLNLGQNTLQSQNSLQTSGLNSQNAQSLLGLQNQFANTGLNQNAQQYQNQQFNAGQLNNNGLQNRQLTLQDILQQQQYSLGAGGLNSQNAQFNAGQNNQLAQNYQQQSQAAQEAMYGRQANGMNQLAAYIAQFGLAGIPGGSGNVNVSPIQQAQGGGIGSVLGGLGSLAGGLASF